jgi:AcrR family transcriptional regulator
MTLEQPKRPDRRGQLLETALELFSERGVDGSSMRELAKRAGVNVAAAYHHFESKRALLRAVFAELGSLDDIGARLEPAVLAMMRTVPKAEALALILDVSWTRMETNASYYGLLHAEVLRGDPDARAVSLEMWDGWGEQLRATLRAAEIATSQPRARELASAVRTTLWGLFNEARLIGAPDDNTRAARARAAARALAGDYL